jgi:hypothetical protein
MIMVQLTRITEVRDYCLTDNTAIMNALIKYFFALPLVLFFIVACNGNKEPVAGKISGSESVTDTGLIVVAKDIITEVIVSKIADGDPWEAEKIQGYNGKKMIDKLFDDIYSRRLIVYDYYTGLELTPKEVKKLEEGFNSDRSAIGKIQFAEDWYLDPKTDTFVKDIKSIVFGSEMKEESGNIYGYKAIFQVNLK